MTFLFPSSSDQYYASTLHYPQYQPPAPVTQTLSSIRFTTTDSTPPIDPEMHALRTMLSAHRTLPYAGRRSCTSTKNNTLNNRLAYVEALVGKNDPLATLAIISISHTVFHGPKLNSIYIIIDTNALVIETMWCSNSSSHSRQAAVVPLRTFIQEVLKRSRTTYSTLQTALFYLFRSRPAITAHLRQGQQDKWEGAYISCGRRMFLASLVVASKFVQDKTYRNSAWAKIAGLPVAEINAAERIFLDLVDYRLFISQPTFEQWHHLLHLHVESKTQQHPMVLLPYNLNMSSSTTSPLSATPTFALTASSSSSPSSSSPTSSSTSSSLMSSPSLPTTPPTLAYPPFSSGGSGTTSATHFHHYHYQYPHHPPLSYQHQQQLYYEPPTATMTKRKRQRQHTSSDIFTTCLSPSPSSTPMPVLAVSLPSSNHSSPLQTPTQISPIRCQLWKPTSPKKRKLEGDHFIHQPTTTRPWKQRHL